MGRGYVICTKIQAVESFRNHLLPHIVADNKGTRDHEEEKKAWLGYLDDMLDSGMIEPWQHELWKHPVCLYPTPKQESV